jgi:hypothetical protein
VGAARRFDAPPAGAPRGRGAIAVLARSGLDRVLSVGSGVLRTRAKESPSPGVYRSY